MTVLHANKHLGEEEQMKTLMNLIRNEGYPIEIEDLVEKSGLDENVVKKLAIILAERKEVYFIGNPPTYRISLFWPEEYWKSGFKSPLDKAIFDLLKKSDEPMTIIEISNKLAVSDGDVVACTNTLIKQNRILFVNGNGVREMRFAINPEASRKIV